MSAAPAKLFPRDLFSVYLCCNNPDNGNFLGRLWSLKIGDMSFDVIYPPRHGPKVRFIYERGSVRRMQIAARHFPVRSHGEWVGNWCWDSVTMEGQHLLRFMNWPRLRKWFSIESGETRLFNLWKDGRDFTDDDLRLIESF